MKFIHFGCWNELLRFRKRIFENGVSTVIKSLISNDDPQIQFYVIAGDNRYPLKHPEKNMKMFDNRDFDSGFECARKTTRKLHTY